MALQSYTVVLTVVIVLLSTYGTNFSAADTDKDKEECQEPLVGLATCLLYVGGNAKTPTPDCCSGLKQVLKTDKKCLCVVIKDRNDPDLGLNINVTLAFGLPSVCHAPANVSACPDLLKLPPNSPEAQVFYQFGNGSKNAASSPAPSPSSNNAKSEGTSASQKNSSGKNSGFVWRFYFGIFLQFTLVAKVGIDL